MAFTWRQRASKTATELGVYDYLPANGEVRLTGLLIPGVDKTRLQLESVTVADLVHAISSK
jgi:hypothetical protein